MANEQDIEIEPQDSSSTSETDEGAALKGIKRRSFSKLRRELDEDELNTPAVQKLLIDDIERLERENNELVDYRDRYYQANTEKAVLNQKLRSSISQEIVSVVCMTVGAAALGYAPALWSNQPAGWIAIAFGGVLILGGILAKAVRV